uniref:Importin N-terminal domain-containing protein n=1 Tax=Denticeps clupeoides TaxID=299321 RepID=A0AAY4D9F0_9TELE
MDEPVAAMCDQLIKAVNVMMDAESSQRYRLEALKFCEEFKEKCPFCVQCGLQLSEKVHSPVIRHFGLQILEHVIKFRWNNMSQQEKVHLKNCAMGLLSNGTTSILEEESHIKDALSRIIVEMIKREWPQQWPDMLKEMETLTSLGDAQTELVLLILLRLVEDVITFQTLPTQRRRDIYLALTQHMDSIFSFLLNILQQHVDDYRRLVSVHMFHLAKAHCRVGVAALNTLAGYIDWVTMVHITHDNCRLLEVLCLLLSEPELQMEAAECLIIAISRKGKLEDRIPLMVLFDDVAMHYIVSSAQSADGAVKCNKSDSLHFLKRLCQLLCALGGQLCSLVGSHVEVPTNIDKFMEAFLAFTTHPSQFLKSSTQITWGTFFRHEVLSKDPVIIQMAVRYIRETMTNLVKRGFPSKNDSPSCQYSRVDFDSDEDFNHFFNSFRAQEGEVVRNACRIIPLEAFLISSEWLKYQISQPINTGSTTSKTGEGLCSILSPSAVQWDAMTFFTEGVVGQLFKNVEREKLPVEQGIELLQEVLNYETRDPLILSCVLTNVSSLFPFITYKPQLLPLVLIKQLFFCFFYINQFKDYNKQEAFLEELLAPVRALWLSEEMSSVLSDPVLFLKYVGADQVLTDPNTEDQFGLNRSRISFCVYTLMGVVKRARWPTDQQEAQAGGFVVGCSSTGAPIHRSPCTAQVLGLLPNLLAFIRTHNCLFLPENVAHLSETFTRVHEVMDVERNLVLGLPQPVLDIYDSPVYKTTLERMQGFFCTLYDNCFHVMGNLGPSLHQDFYTIEGLAEQIIGSMFTNLDSLPDNRLRPLIHILLIIWHLCHVKNF